MPELDLRMLAAEVEPHAAEPRLTFKLRVTATGGATRIRNVMLQTQIRIEATRRRYGPDEQARLGELFGAPDDWPRTLRSLLWTHVNVTTPPFEESCIVDLPVPCSYDFNLAATKYFHGLEDGEAPLLLLFSGSIFYEDEGGALQLDPIPWSKESSYRLPIRLWQELMQRYYPDSVPLRLSRDVLDRLHRYKRTHGFVTWDGALARLLDDCTEGAA